MSLLERLLRSSFICFLVLNCSSQSLYSQSNEWKESMSSPWIGQVSTSLYDIKFKDNGPFGFGWIYGNWLDLDSNLRLAAYRQDGEWKSIPVYSKGPSLSWVSDIAQYGDTLYLCGRFSNLIYEPDTSKKIPNTSLIKIYNDSIWSYPWYFTNPLAMTSSGDTLLVWANSYLKDSIGIPDNIMTTDGGHSWQYPYSLPPPGLNLGPYTRFEINDGKIYLIQSSGIDTTMGVIVWDGSDWEVLGEGIFGTYSRPSNFIFYNDEIYMSGHYTKQEDPRNPGDFITRWNGSTWEEFGGGGIVDFVLSDGLALLDSHLVCHSLSQYYGDAKIPYIAGWDGHQWCGTPINYSPSVLKGPTRMGVINDTLYSFCGTSPLYANGKPMSLLNYYDGDYFNGPLAICSTPGLGKQEEELVYSMIDVFPNPSKDIIRINHPEPDRQTELVTIALYSIAGKLVFEQEVLNWPLQLDISSLPAGIYVLKCGSPLNNYQAYSLVKK